MSTQASSTILKWCYLHPRYWGTWLLILFMRLSILLPFAWQITLGKSIGCLVFFAVPKRKRIAKTNLKLCFPERNETEIQTLAKQAFQNAGIAIFETAIAWWASDAYIRKLYDVEGEEHIQQAQNNKQAILLLSGHFCSTEIGGRLIRINNGHFQAMYKPAKNKLYNAFMCKYRSQHFDIIERKNSKQFIRNLRKGQMSWYAPDQNLNNEDHVFAPFFNVPTLTITATSRIAQISKATVIPMHPVRIGKRYKLILGSPLENFPSNDMLQDAEQVNKSIEKGILLAPSQYLWGHKRFHILPDGSQRQYH